MTLRKSAVVLSMLLLCVLWVTPAQSRPSSPVDSCAGPSALLTVLDRPTISDSVCSVKKNNVLAELGYDYQVETGTHFGTLQTLPQLELRYGAGDNVELKLFPPNYLLQSTFAAGKTGSLDGFGDAGLGMKYEFRYGERWGIATDTAITIPSGSKGFTGKGTGVILNGIVAYNLNADIGIGFQLGVYRLFNPAYAGQETTVNPIIVVSDQLNEITENLQLYAECYNAIDVQHNTGIASYIDSGVQYLLLPNVEVDFEAGHNLSDLSSDAVTYIGFGTGLEF